MDTIFELALKVQANMADEAEAIKGYTEQGEVISRLAQEHPGIDVTRLEQMNDEIIADEMKHQEMLLKMYKEITGIDAAK